MFFGAPDSHDCRYALRSVLETSARLGVLIASHKTEGPASVITFLGIELDTEASTLRLPEEKLVRLKREICDGKEDALAQRGSCYLRSAISNMHVVLSGLEDHL